MTSDISLNRQLGSTYLKPRENRNEEKTSTNLAIYAHCQLNIQLRKTTIEKLLIGATDVRTKTKFTEKKNKKRQTYSKLVETKSRKCNALFKFMYQSSSRLKGYEKGRESTSRVEVVEV